MRGNAAARGDSTPENRRIAGVRVCISDVTELIGAAAPVYRGALNRSD